MRFNLLVSLLVSMVLLNPSIRADDEVAVRKMFGDYASAFNAKDEQKVASFWTLDSRYLDRQTGERTEGRAAIAADITGAFADRPDDRLVGRVDDVRFIKSDVASVSGVVTVGNPIERPESVDFSAILVLENGRWLFDSVEESATPVPATPSDALGRLKWLVGKWEDQSESAMVENVFRWSDNGSFLIRSFASQSAEGEISRGTQVIGWDPRSLEIRSWTFNSDGSFGDATWSNNGDDWLIKSSQTLAGGDAASGTYVLSKVSKDEVTLKLIGLEIGGEPQPSGPAASLVRRPAPAVGARSAAETGDQTEGSEK